MSKPKARAGPAPAHTNDDDDEPPSRIRARTTFDDWPTAPFQPPRETVRQQFLRQADAVSGPAVAGTQGTTMTGAFARLAAVCASLMANLGACARPAPEKAALLFAAREIELEIELCREFPPLVGRAAVLWLALIALQRRSERTSGSAPTSSAT